VRHAPAIGNQAGQRPAGGFDVTGEIGGGGRQRRKRLVDGGVVAEA
jgi:hypothetical protein